MKHFVIGTAGHIDHGKTALIRALTGQDTDRLPEEKRRGITTDLGFAHFDLGEGHLAGIIDVPGHEKFIHNMAAGVPGMDLVLLVIAADEGIMPQTREHMDILRLLGVNNYIVVLNKCDLADEEWLDMVEEEVKSELNKNGFGAASIVRTSARTGEGIDELKKQIQEFVQRTDTDGISPEDRVEAPARLPADRVFTVQGFGTVVTGTMLGGRIEKGQELTIYPAQKKCRVRGIQVCGTEQEMCAAGQRAALNLSGTDRGDIRRGDVLAQPGSLKSSRMINVRLNILERSERIVKNQSRLHFYSGTSQVLCRVSLLDADCLAPGESGYARLRLENEAVLRRGDRFIVRFYSPLETIGGGVVLETDVCREGRFRKEMLERLRKKETAAPQDLAEFAVKETRGGMADISGLCAELGVSEQTAGLYLQKLRAEGRVYAFSVNGTEYFLHQEAEQRLRTALLEEIKKYLSVYSYRPGIPEAQLQSTALDSLGKAAAVVYVDWLLTIHVLGCLDLRACQAGRALYKKQSTRLLFPNGYEPEKDRAYRTVESVFSQTAKAAGYHFPSLESMSFPQVQPDDIGEIMRLLELQGKALYLSADICTLPSLADKAVEKIREILEEEGRIAITRVCGLLDTSRKNARLMLDYTDRMGITRKDKAESERVKAI